MDDRIVYLDYAATSPLIEESACAMEPYLKPGVSNILVNANPNTLYEAGRKAYADLETYRKSITELLGAERPDEILFTSGATESDNAALLGIAMAALSKRRLGAGVKPRVITTSIEHDAVLGPARLLEQNGFDVVYLKPSRTGHISLKDLDEALTDETLLVSIQMANSEVGSIQPIKDAAELAHTYGALFHTDAVQALGKVPINLSSLGVDAASFSAHKIGGPRGIGCLYLKSRTPFQVQILGGGQERGLRSGTQNLCGICGFEAALRSTVSQLHEDSERLRSYQAHLLEKLEDKEGVKLTVDPRKCEGDFLPNIVNMMVPGIESETAVLRFDSQGICVSGGSACSSHSLDPSHVLSALGIRDDDAYCALRVSMGRYTKAEDIEAFLNGLDKVMDWRGGCGK